MTQAKGGPPQVFVWYESRSGVLVPLFLVPANSKHEALKGLEQGGHTLGRLVATEECDPADLLRLTLPGISLMLMQMQALLGIVAQDAQERIVERSKGRLGLVKGS